MTDRSGPKRERRVVKNATPTPFAPPICAVQTLAGVFRIRAYTQLFFFPPKKGKQVPFPFLVSIPQHSSSIGKKIPIIPFVSPIKSIKIEYGISATLTLS